MSEKAKSITIRFAPSLVARAKAVAEMNKRPFNSEVNVALENHVQQMELDRNNRRPR